MIRNIRPLHENDPLYVMNPPRLAADVPCMLIWIGLIAALITAWVSIAGYVYNMFFE